MSDVATGKRLTEVDALRGLAAAAVVLFHYTTRFTEVYRPTTSPSFSFPDGQYGVNLFFIISGFVIFMTLERTHRPSDFVVSRFSRLFPAYWAAIALTFVITHWLGLPGKLSQPGDALANMLMLHGLFRVPHVDGAYWTLEVELLFYFGMLLLYCLGRLHQIHFALLALLLLRVVYFGAAQVFGIDLSWTLSRLLILPYIPWFALGIATFLLLHARDQPSRRWPAITSVCAVLTLLVSESIFSAALAVTLSVLVFLAASGRGTWLRARPLIWLGTVSYPLYLLHENIGWSVQLQLLSFGLPIDLAIIVALILSLTLAGLVTRLVEQPAMRWIRTRYKRWRQPAPI